jgi:hypothetical protein
MAVLLTNNVASTLAADLTIGATSLNVAVGTGAKFPSPTAPDYFYATIISTVGEIEIVKVTARVNDILTIVRAQDSTTAKVFAAGSRVEVRVNAKSVLDAVDDGVAEMTVVTNALDGRLDTAEADIVALEAADVSLDGRLDTAETNITTIQDIIGPQGAYVSKIVDAKRYGLVPNDQAAGPANFIALNAAISAANGKILQMPEDAGVYEFALNPGTVTQATQTATFTGVTEIRGGGARLQNLRFLSGANYQRFIDIKQQYANFVGNITGGNTVYIRHSGVVWKGFDLRAQSATQNGNTGSFDIGRASTGMIYDIKLLDGYASNGSVDSVDIYGNVDNLLVRGVTLRSGDDGVVLKSSISTGPVRNVVVADCDIECASMFAIGSAVAFDISNVTVSNCLHSRYGTCLYLKNTNTTHFGGNIYNVNVSDIVLSSPANPTGAYNASNPPYIQKIIWLNSTTGGNIEKVTVRNIRFDGVTLNSSLGGTYVAFIQSVAPAVIGDIVIDGIDIYQADPGAYTDAASWSSLLFARGAGTFGPLYMGNITYNAYGNAGMNILFRVDTGANVPLNITNPIIIKKSVASSEIANVSTGAGTLTLEANANIAMPTTTALSASTGFKSGNSPVAKAQRQITVPIPNVTAGVALTMSAMNSARRCMVTRVTICTPTAVTQSDTNYITLQFRGTGNVATATTQVTGGVNLLANTQVDLGVPNIGYVAASGEVMRFLVTHTGSGQALTGALLTIHVIDME